jgi:hypothetical protein
VTYTPAQMEIAAALHRREGHIYGLTRIDRPQCTAPKTMTAGRCNQEALYTTADGQQLCTFHAIQWAEKQ